ncbi:P-loop containing nucleoside triphosphate hydrolase protein, partial [Cylindrobasidium torrendii FP15055 ss-10]
LDILSKAYFDQMSLVALKPIRTENEVAVSREKGEVIAISQRYKTKIREPGQKQHLQVITLANNGRSVAERAKLSGAPDGRTAKIATSSRRDVLRVITVGREDPTSAEAQKLDLILGTLCNNTTITSSPYFCTIFKTGVAVFAPSTRMLASSDQFTERELNPSQRRAVDAILSNSPKTSCVVIHGPPGTGKTTVIAAAAMAGFRSDPKRTIWLVAQSNVAVKNIAEKLATLGFLQFKILVSHDFHYDWHEHLYEPIKRNLIRSDDFKQDDLAMSRDLQGSRVILCTISMLSSNRIGAIIRVVPVDTLVVDEASQIEVGSYLHPLHRYAKSLKKMVFIGDDKQLPPFGDNEIKGLESIFEKPHLRSNAVFLNTQYRMPIPLGKFISKNVYGNKLKSVHDIGTPCCLFVNTVGIEEKQGHSWINKGEAATVCRLAKLLQRRNRAFKVITPYDSQRGLLQKALKDSGLEWENKCFNVDSFQGNEEDYIIVSVVRTNNLGFLNDARRMNVMLTRCKKGMFICSSRGFLDGPAKSTLVGKLAREVGDAGWTTAQRVLNGDLSFLA